MYICVSISGESPVYTLTSPNYPDNYPNNYENDVNLAVSNGTVHVRIAALDLHVCEDCLCDRVNVSFFTLLHALYSIASTPGMLAGGCAKVVCALNS